MQVDLTRADFDDLSAQAQNCLLLFTTMLFRDDRGSADLDTFQGFVSSLKNEFLGPKIFSFEKHPIEFPRIPLLHANLKTLAQRGFLAEINFTGHISWRISRDFSNLAELIYDKITETDGDANTPENSNTDMVPAADRFVSVNHNSSEFDLTLEGLDKIEQRIKDSNELSASPEERIVLSQEVNYLRTMLSQRVVRAQAIWSATKASGILHYLSEHGSDAMLNALALEVTSHILKLFGWS